MDDVNPTTQTKIKVEGGEEEKRENGWGIETKEWPRKGGRAEKGDDVGKGKERIETKEE